MCVQQTNIDLENQNKQTKFFKFENNVKSYKWNYILSKRFLKDMHKFIRNSCIHSIFLD